MHPILTQAERIGVYLAAWLILGLLLTALTVASGQVDIAPSVLFILPLTLVYSFVCLSAWYLCRAFPLSKTPFPRLAFTHLVAAAFAGSFGLLLGTGWRSVINQLPLGSSSASFPEIDVRLLFGIAAVLFLLAVAVHYLIVAFEDSRAVERRVLELKLLAQEAELKALRAQIDPHFLFNSLNSVSALTTRNPSAAREMTLLLADFLRKSLKFGTNQEITLSEELSLATNFLEIEQVRFGSRLRVDLAVDEHAHQCLVPPLLLQPLLENAINHGIAHLVDGGTIQLRAYRNGTRLRLTLENPCDPHRPQSTGTGIGLENIRLRLRSLYDTEARVDLYEDKRVFRVELSLPLHDLPGPHEASTEK